MNLCMKQHLSSPAVTTSSSLIPAIQARSQAASESTSEHQQTLAGWAAAGGSRSSTTAAAVLDTKHLTTVGDQQSSGWLIGGVVVPFHCFSRPNSPYRIYHACDRCCMPPNSSSESVVLLSPAVQACHSRWTFLSGHLTRNLCQI
jgi:hypothetical protein